jgi:hypothetical protein
MDTQFFDSHGATPDKLVDLLLSIDGGDIAASDLRNTLAGNPRNTRAWFLLGKLHLRMGNTVEAKICLRLLKELKSELAVDLEKEISKVSENKVSSSL